VRVIRTDTAPDAVDVVTFRVDPDAEPGNASPALARLLIGIDRRRRERAAAELAGEQPSQTKPETRPPNRKNEGPRTRPRDPSENQTT